MILSQKFIEELRVLNQLDYDLYEKAITFAFNSVVKNENEIVEFLEIDNADAEALMDVMLKLIFYFSKYRATTLELDICLEATQLQERKRTFFKQRLLTHLNDVRKKLFKKFQDNSDRLKDVAWRLQIEVASKTHKNDFKPNITLDLITADNKGNQKHNMFSIDYANLKNLHQVLLHAFKQHDSSQHKKVINSYL